MKSLLEFWKLFKRKKQTAIEKKEDREIETSTVSDARDDIKSIRKKPSRIFKKRQEKANIQVGIDFGTSATKIVFSQLGKRQFRVIDFNHKLPNYPSYCIPSVCSFGDDGKLHMGASAARLLLNKEWDTGLQRLKVVLAGKYDDKFSDDLTNQNYFNYFDLHNKKIIEPEVLISVFIAYVMKISREKIIRLPEYKNCEMNLAFNICMPIDHISNNVLKHEFEKVFSRAELVEKEWNIATSDFNPLSFANSLKGCLIKQGTKVFSVPESVASFASYLISLGKREGLHAIIDLGSGTTDLSICNLFLDKDSTKTYWYAARNLSIGTTKIERMIANFLNQKIDNKKCTSKDICDCIENLSFKKRKRQFNPIFTS